MDYSILSDEELVSLAKNGDSGAVNTIIKRYEPIIEKIKTIGNYYLKGGDDNDLIQRGRMAVLSAINGYKSEFQTKFSTYANKCIKNEFNSAISETKNTPLNDSESLCFFHNGDEDKNDNIADTRYNPEESAINEETELEQKLAIKNILSGFEYKVYELKELGHKNQAISKILKCDKKSIENAYNRIKQKAPKISDTIKKHGL